MKKTAVAVALSTAGFATLALALDAGKGVGDEVIAIQREALASNTEGSGAGPQSPRDIDSSSGENSVVFGNAPASAEMNLCNIHFHESAEHKGGQFTTYAGNGDGKGYGSGYVYDGELSEAELAPLEEGVCAGAHGDLQSGDTIEVHYVHSTAKVGPGATLGACLSDDINNPQFRVEAQVYVLVNDDNAADFAELAGVGEVEGKSQALAIPGDTGEPVVYQGSTTGPKYNEVHSPFQVTWSVRPQVKKVNIASVGEWCKSNPFDEDHAHGVRNLVMNPALLSPF